MFEPTTIVRGESERADVPLRTDSLMSLTQQSPNSGPWTGTSPWVVWYRGTQKE